MFHILYYNTVFNNVGSMNLKPQYVVVLNGIIQFEGMNIKRSDIQGSVDISNEESGDNVVTLQGLSCSDLKDPHEGTL